MSQILDPAPPAPAPEHHSHQRTRSPEPWRTLFIVTVLLLVISIVVLTLSLTVFKAEAAAAPTPTPTESTPPTPVVTPAVACSTENTKVTVGERSAAAGSTVIPLVFTNTSSAPCAMTGYPMVAFVGDGNGTQIGAAAGHDTTVAPMHIALAPHGSAGSMVTVVDASDVCTDPVAADGFRAVLPGAKSAFFVPIKGLEACTTGQSLLTVTPIAGP